MYAEQIRRYLKHFDMEQFLFLFIEDLMADPNSTLAAVYGFLGVEPYQHAVMGKTFNAANAPRFPLLHDFILKPNPLKRRFGKLLSTEQKYWIAGKLLAFNRRNVVYPSLSTELERELRVHFAADVRDLQTLTGRDLSAWLPLSEPGA
jgi:hypothetical protein